MRPITLAIIAVLAAACALQCSRSHQLRDVLPSCVPAEVTQLLVAEDEAPYRAYVRSAGMMQTLDLYGIIEQAYDVSSPDRYARSEHVLAGAHKRVADAVATQFRLPYYSYLVADIARRPQDQRMELRRLMRECGEMGAGDATPDALATVHRHLERFRATNFPYGVELATRCLSSMYANAGDNDRSLRYFVRRVQYERELGYTRMLVQSLGEWGAMHASRGDIDSMRVCWNEALQLAMEYRMPDQAPRLLNFYARFYRRQGQTALAHTTLRESVAIAEEYGAGYYRERFVLELADFYASFEHWSITSRLIDRAEIVGAPDLCAVVNPDQILSLRAEMLLATGQTEEALRTYQQIWESFSGVTHLGKRALLLHGWARGLIRDGQPERAIELIDRALRMETGANMALWLSRAQASHDLQQLRECDEALEQFASLAEVEFPTPYADWLVHDALRIDASLARGDSLNAWRHAAIGLERLTEYLSHTDAGVEGYLTVARAERFRSSLHRLIRDNPVLGYGAALFWVESYQFLGTQRADERNTSTQPRTLVEGMLRRAAARSRASMAHLRGAHWVYAVVGSDVLAWTATSSGVAQHKIALDAPELRDLVSKACEELAERTGQGSPNRSIDRLSTLLLPALPPPGTCILVTPDAWLGAFPFEALNVGREQYRPLLADHDVAYLRPGLTSKVAPVVSPPLVFVSPEPQGELTHRFPFQPALQAAVDEARAVQSALPGARLLTGEQATRKALLSSWETTGVVYVIGHVLRDPEVPFMVMIPAAPTPEAHSSAYVEVTDIRSMDLSRCGLVVLSGCSSGLPYAGQGAHAPSLAQACIDAGARSVVHTFWDIDDREASDLMTDFIDKRRNGMTTIRALAEARRARMQSAGAGSFDWASYGILINSPELVQAENVSSARSR